MRAPAPPAVPMPKAPCPPAPHEPRLGSAPRLPGRRRAPPAWFPSEPSAPQQEARWKRTTPPAALENGLASAWATRPRPRLSTRLQQQSPTRQGRSAALRREATKPAMRRGRPIGPHRHRRVSVRLRQHLAQVLRRPGREARSTGRRTLSAPPRCSPRAPPRRASERWGR